MLKSLLQRVYCMFKRLIIRFSIPSGLSLICNVVCLSNVI